MININELSEILPLRYDSKVLDFVSFKNSEWYINNCRRDYYNEFSDFDFKNDISEEKLRTILGNMITSYELKTQLPYEARLVLKDTEINQIVGGCTLLESNNSLSLSYFVVPDFQRQGIAYNMLKNLITATSKSKIKFDKYIVTIQSDNIASLSLVKKLHFKNLGEQPGRFGMNKKLYLEREKYNI